MSKSKIILAQLALILDSHAFKNSERRCHTLKFIIQNDLAGKKEENTAEGIAQSLPGHRDAQYTKTLMQELRKKLKSYYENSDDYTVKIEIPIGRYWPVYEFRKLSNPIEFWDPQGNVDRLIPHSPRSQKAQEYYTDGYQYWTERRPESILKAIHLFQQAIQEEHSNFSSCYADAYAAVAECYTFLYLTGAKHSEVYSNAKSHAQTGINHAPYSEITNAAFGAVLAIFERDWENAERYFKRAMEINPNYPSAHGWYSGQLAAVGRNAEAVHHALQVRKLDPLSTFAHAHAAKVLYFCRNYDDSMEILQRLISNEPYNPFVCVFLGMNLVAKGNFEQAIDLLKRATQIMNRNVLSLSTLGNAYARANRTAEAKEIIEEIETLSAQQNSYVPQSLVAQIWVGLNQVEKAFTCLEAAYTDWDFYLLSIQGWEVFNPIRSDPRFYALSARLGLIDNSSEQTAW